MRLDNKLPLVLALLLGVAGCSSSSNLLNESAKQDAAVGEAALTAGTPGIALRLADETLAANPADAGALTRRGLALTELGRLEEARESLAKAVATDPHNQRALLALGRVELPTDPAAAETTLQTALHLNGQNAAILNNLGIARDLQGHHVQAEAAYRAALAVSPEMTATRVNLALCLAFQGQGAKAIGLLRPLAEDPAATRKVREDYATVLVMAGERTEAQGILAGTMASNQVVPALDVLALARINGNGVTR